MIWSDQAITDLETLRSYIAKDKPDAAKSVVVRILELAESLIDQPGLGRPGRVLGTRELIVPNTPYIIPYRERKNRIEIIRVLHGSMRWPEKF